MDTDLVTIEKSADAGLTWHPVVMANEAPAVSGFLSYIMGQDPTATITIFYYGRSVTFRAIS